MASYFITGILYRVYSHKGMLQVLRILSLPVIHKRVETWLKYRLVNNLCCGFPVSKCGLHETSNFVKYLFHESTAVIIINSFYKNYIITTIVLIQGAGKFCFEKSDVAVQYCNLEKQN